MKFDYKECIKQGLLRKIPVSKQKSVKSLKTADKWLMEASKNIQAESFYSSLLASYLAMFHSSRAILFIEGYREKSHACIARYLEKFVENKTLEKEWVELLDFYRETRHSSQYGLDFIVTKIETEKAFNSAKSFVNRMKKLLGKLVE